MKSLLINLIYFSTFLNAQNTWTQKADFGGGIRAQAVGFSIGNKGYFGTGVKNASSSQHDFWEWDQATDTWAQKADFPSMAGRTGAVGFSINSKGYIGGTKDFWEYSQAGNTWTKKSDFPGADRINAFAFAIGNKGYIGGGWDGSFAYNYYNDFWEYDQTTDTWAKKADFGGPKRYGATAFSIGNKGYAGTGIGPDVVPGYNVDFKDFWEWNQATDTWTKKTDFGGGPRMHAVGFSIGNKGYTGTGFNMTGTFMQDFWEYDPLGDLWTLKAAFPGAPRGEASAFSIGAKGYIGIGRLSLTLFKDFWEYSPGSTTINEYHMQNGICISPNPFQTSTTIAFGKELSSAELVVYATSGHVVKIIKDISGSQIRVEREQLPKGIYFIRLVQDDFVLSVGKLVVSD